MGLSSDFGVISAFRIAIGSRVSGGIAKHFTGLANVAARGVLSNLPFLGTIRYCGR